MILVAAVVGLGAGCQATGSSDACALGAERVVGRSVDNDFDDIALLPLGDDAVALWADSRGLFGRRLRASGAPDSDERRLGPPCDGGLSATSLDDGLLLACLLHAREDKDGDPGGVLLLELDRSLVERRRRYVRGAGVVSDGVSLARAGPRVALAWHDATPDAQRVRFASWRDELPTEIEPRVISRRLHVAASPSVTLTPRLAVTWAERWLEGGELRSALLYWEGRGAPRPVLELTHLWAMPRLLGFGERLVLAYRDRPSRRRRTGLYLARLGTSGRMVGESLRVGRADGVGRPELRPCMGGLLTATPRTYGGDYFVGINWFDEGLRQPRGEQQFYEDVHAFTQAAAACLGDSALILIAEHGQLERPHTALRAVPYVCGAGQVAGAEISIARLERAAR